MYIKKADSWLKHIDFIIVDSLSLIISMCLAYFFRFRQWTIFENNNNVFFFLIVFVYNFVFLLVTNNYGGVLRRGYWIEFKKTLLHTIILFGFITIIMFLLKASSDYSRLFILYLLTIYTLLLYSLVVIWKEVVRRKLKDAPDRTLCIITESEIADSIVSSFVENNTGYKIIGVVLENDNQQKSEINGIPVIANYDSVSDYIKLNWVDEVLVYLNTSRLDSIKNLLRDIEDMGTTLHIVIGKRDSHRFFSNNIGPYSCITRAMNSTTLGQAIAKRTLDIIGGFFGCILTGILYLIIAPKIKKESPGPAIYKSTRIGLNGKPFTMYKFRSMYLDADERKKELLEKNTIKGNLMFKLDFDPRIIGNYIDENGVEHTGIGEKIRRTSLDEFPQFWNVLKGDMSLVGTRPPTPDETEKYEKHHKARLAIKPGITGLWQVSGRSDIVDFEEVVALDRDYINNYSFGLDLRILLKTVAVVFNKKGAK